jgi:hypothetical protein
VKVLNSGGSLSFIEFSGNARLTSAAIVHAGALHQTQATVVGGRLGQTVNFVQPNPLPYNLEAAPRTKALAKLAAPKTGNMQPLYPLLPPIDPAVICQISMCIGVFAIPPKAGMVSKLVEVRRLLNAINFTLTSCYSSQTYRTELGFSRKLMTP